MKTKDFYYDLPKELIAQTPLEPRDSSKLMVLGRSNGKISHEIFSDIVTNISPNDCLIMNDSRVLPARLYGKKVDTGAHVEFLLLKHKTTDTWEVMAGPGKKAKPGTKFVFEGSQLSCEVQDITADGNRIVEFSYPKDRSFYDVLDEVGQMPLPHYITKKLDNKERYQTVYSRELGSAAAPTAGLHFTNNLLKQIKDKGVKIGFVTLHVGLGTFRPVKVENITEHKMHSEHYQLSQETADLIKETKKSGGKVFAVGTTTCRTLESIANTYNTLKACEGWTDIFIYPGYEFKVIDGLITNFHLPESTLIMLVSAFAGYENAMNAYKVAVKEKYRFFSFGDAMMIY